MRSEAIGRRLFVGGALALACLAAAPGAAQPALAALIDQLARLSDGVVKLAEAFEKVVRIGYRLDDVVRRREEDAQLRTLHGELLDLYVGQMDLLDGWPVLKAPPPPERWRRLQQRMAETRRRIDAVRAGLARYAGTYAQDRTDDILTLRRIGAMRGMILSTVAEDGVPATPEQFAAVNALRARYADLLAKFRRLTVAMGRYIALPDDR